MQKRMVKSAAAGAARAGLPVAQAATAGDARSSRKERDGGWEGERERRGGGGGREWRAQGGRGVEGRVWLTTIFRALPLSAACARGFYPLLLLLLSSLRLGMRRLGRLLILTPRKRHRGGPDSSGNRTPWRALIRQKALALTTFTKSLRNEGVGFREKLCDVLPISLWSGEKVLLFSINDNTYSHHFQPRPTFCATL